MNSSREFKHVCIKGCTFCLLYLAAKTKDATFAWRVAPDAVKYPTLPGNNILVFTEVAVAQVQYGDWELAFTLIQRRAGSAGGYDFLGTEPDRIIYVQLDVRSACCAGEDHTEYFTQLFTSAALHYLANRQLSDELVGHIDVPAAEGLLQLLDIVPPMAERSQLFARQHPISAVAATLPPPMDDIDPEWLEGVLSAA